MRIGISGNREWLVKAMAAAIADSGYQVIVGSRGRGPSQFSSERTSKLGAKYQWRK